MNQHQNPTTSFEDRLLNQLRAVVAERGAAVAAEELTSGGTRSWRRGPRLALAGAGVAAVAAATLIVSAGADNAPAAYAVEPQGDGQLSVEIHSLEDAEGLEEALGEAGIPADVNYLSTGMTCKEPRFQPASTGGRVTSGLSQGGDGGTVFTISRNAVGPGQTLVLTASPGPGGKGEAVQMAVAEGAVASCEPVEAPAGAPPAGASQGGEGADSGPSTSEAGPNAPEKGLTIDGAH